jgi:hypothetical protein
MGAASKSGIGAFDFDDFAEQNLAFGLGTVGRTCQVGFSFVCLCWVFSFYLLLFVRYVDDPRFHALLTRVKMMNKEKLIAYIFKSQGIRIPATMMFDVHIKRIHE